MLLLNGRHLLMADSAIVRSRLPVAYNPDATAPVDLLNFSGWVVLRRGHSNFAGVYRLRPDSSNKAAHDAVIRVTAAVVTNRCGTVYHLRHEYERRQHRQDFENRFACADLEHILLCVDDDMWMEALRQDHS